MLQEERSAELLAQPTHPQQQNTLTRCADSWARRRGSPPPGPTVWPGPASGACRSGTCWAQRERGCRSRLCRRSGLARAPRSHPRTPAGTSCSSAVTRNWDAGRPTGTPHPPRRKPRPGRRARVPAPAPAPPAPRPGAAPVGPGPAAAVWCAPGGGSSSRGGRGPARPPRTSPPPRARGRRCAGSYRRPWRCGCPPSPSPAPWRCPPLPGAQPCPVRCRGTRGPAGLGRSGAALDTPRGPRRGREQEPGGAAGSGSEGFAGRSTCRQPTRTPAGPGLPAGLPLQLPGAPGRFAFPVYPKSPVSTSRDALTAVSRLTDISRSKRLCHCNNRQQEKNK